MISCRTTINRTARPKVSVIILNFDGLRNCGPLFGRCLVSTLSTDYPNFEVLLVDNASTDKSLMYVEANYSNYDKLKVIALGANYGFAKGNNLGTKKTDLESKYFVFLSPDVEVSPSWLHNLINVMEDNRDIGIAQPLSLRIDKQGIDSIGCLIDRFAFSHDCLSVNNMARTKSVEIFYAEGLALAIRRQLFEELGGFDNDYFVLEEDVDLCWRARLKGYKVVTVLQSVVHHARGSTIPGKRVKFSSLAQFHTTRNRLVTMIKNYSTANVLKYILFSVMLELAKAVWFISNRKPQIGVAVLNAILDTLKNSKYIWKKHEYVQQNVRKVSDTEIMKNMAPTAMALRSLISCLSLREEK